MKLCGNQACKAVVTEGEEVVITLSTSLMVYINLLIWFLFKYAHFSLILVFQFLVSVVSRGHWNPSSTSEKRVIKSCLFVLLIERWFAYIARKMMGCAQ